MILFMIMKNKTAALTEHYNYGSKQGWKVNYMPHTLIDVKTSVWKLIARANLK